MWCSGDEDEHQIWRSLVQASVSTIQDFLFHDKIVLVMVDR